jgi:6,7-dimethyl-8-ribityllumazine synthase
MASEGAPNLGRVPIDPAWKVAIVRSMWHGQLTSALSESAIRELVQLGMQGSNISVIEVPGAFELPLACQQALAECDGVIAFGIVVQGETHHARLVGEQAAAGLMQVQLAMAKPVVCEVLLVDSVKHAEVRSVGKGGKGSVAARTLLTCLANLAK